MAGVEVSGRCDVGHAGLRVITRTVTVVGLALGLLVMLCGSASAATVGAAASLPMHAKAGAKHRPSVRLVSPPTVALVGAKVKFRGRVVGASRLRALRVRLERKTGRRWRQVVRGRLSKGSTFVLKWTAPKAANAYPLQIVLLAGRRRVAVSRSWKLTVRAKVAPGGQKKQPPTPPTPPTPVVHDVSARTLPVGSMVLLPLPDGVTVDRGEVSSPAAAGLSTAVDNGTLRLSAAANAPLGHSEVMIAAHGCDQSDCDRDLTVRVPVDVTSYEAPPGPLTDFPSPSTDRIQAASSLPEGLPGSRLADELVVTLGTDEAPGTRAAADTVAVAADALVSGGTSELGIYTIRWAAPQDLYARRAQLLALPGVSDVMFHDVGTVGTNALPPGDWNDDGQETTWPFTQIHAQQAWDIQRGGLVKLGIVDQGRVQANHEDLNVVKELGPPGSAAHATHVAGLACAKANGIGVVGVAWGCPIVTSGLNGTSDLDVVTAAISVGLEPGVKVINMSLGRSLDSSRCATVAERNARLTAAQQNANMFRRLFTNKFGKNIVWTISAGNSCEDIVASAWGQNANLPNVIVVGATNSDASELARFSSFGPGVEVAAPGGVDVEPPRNGTVGLWSTWLYGHHNKYTPAECGPGYRYCWYYGTSMAAPIVAGIAELVRSAYPNATADDTANCIVDTATGSATQSDYPTHYSPQIVFTPANALPIVDARAALSCAGGVGSGGGAGQASAPAGSFTQLAAGGFHTCGLRPSGTAMCWGYDIAGQASPPTGRFIQLAAGTFHTCGLRVDGTATCWGQNDEGQASPPAGKFTRLSAEGWYTCGLRTDGTAACWGADLWGEASPPTGSFTQLAAGIWHTCGLRTDGTAACWGDDGYGKASPPAGSFTQLTAGQYHTCGLRTDGTASCWGYDYAGQASPPTGTFTQLTAGEEHTCGLRPSGAAACWGDDDYGKASPPTGSFTQLTAGWDHTCGLRADRTAACWGYDGPPWG